GEEELTLGKRTVPSRAYVSWFNFKGRDQQRLVGELSGGERNRVHLAKLLRAGSNVLLLDEPTNDLDVDTLRALEEALLSFAGCAVVISHDRWFLDRIATHMLAFEGEGADPRAPPPAGAWPGSDAHQPAGRPDPARVFQIPHRQRHRAAPRRSAGAAGAGGGRGGAGRCCHLVCALSSPGRGGAESH